MKIEAARRLLKSSLITESRVSLRAVIKYLQDNGHKASYTDDDNDMVVAETHMEDVIETLDAHQWTLIEERMDKAGTVRNGKVAIMSGNTPLKLIQVGHARVLICQDR